MPENGCKENEPVEWVNDVISKTCPISHSAEFAAVVHSVTQSKRGHLPHSGGWADQPAVLMQMMDIYEAATR